MDFKPKHTFFAIFPLIFIVIWKKMINFAAVEQISREWIIIGIITLIMVIVPLARWLYLRSVRIRNQLQMSYIFTNITHELLTPLTILSASVEHLRALRPEEKQEYDLMDLNIQRTTRLLQQILETSKAQDGSLKLLVSNGDVMRFISETASCLKPLMNSKQLDFSITCKPESMMGWIDTDKLDKIIFNLLSNAAKYTEPNGRVTLDVATNRHFDHITIRVSDTGKGIPKDQMKRLFSRFHDGDYRRSHTFGTGLGLSLTRDLVYLHGGTINCTTYEGQGTTFTVDLPISKDAFSPSQIDESNKTMVPNNIIDMNTEMQSLDFLKSAFPATTDENASRILIVEDNNELSMLMQQLLQSKYHVFTAPDGHEALKIIDKKEVDIIISDIMMPEMDGYELTRQIKQNEETSHLPVILLTAKTQEEDQQAALTAGADDYIAKPFRLKDLQLRIDNIIANRQRILRAFPAGDEVAEGTDITELRPSMDDEFLQRATKCVTDHINDSDYDRETFAADMGASSSTLYNKLRALTGMNISSFIRNIRIKTACQIAKENPDWRVSDIAYRVGFKDPKYFATSFKKEMGIQPKEYFEKMRKGE